MSEKQEKNLLEWEHKELLLQIAAYVFKYRVKNRLSVQEFAEKINYDIDFLAEVEAADRDLTLYEAMALGKRIGFGIVSYERTIGVD